MSYAVREDGQGWRAINSEDDVLQGEYFSEKAPEKTLSQIKIEVWEKIKAERDKRMHDGGYLVAGHWYHSDQASRTQQLGLVAMGENMPIGIKWKVMSNGLVDMSPTLAQQILFSAAANDNAIFIAALEHKLAMEASEDPASYDYSDGWPLSYQDTL